MPTEVRRKSTRSAMIIAFPESARTIWRFMAFTPWNSFTASTLPPPRHRIASDRIGRVHGLGGVVDVRGAVDPRGGDHRALVDQPSDDVRLVRRTSAREIHVAEADD